MIEHQVLTLRHRPIAIRVAAMLVCSVLIWLTPIAATAQTSTNDAAVAAINHALDQVHDAASKADFDRYFAQYTTDGVFLGTDATERWTIEQFKAYARPFFDRGRGWTYISTERYVSVSADSNTAWFDEKLVNENLGDTRGSGVLVKVGSDWKVAQYNLTIPVPNELASDFVRQIRERAQNEQ